MKRYKFDLNQVHFPRIHCSAYNWPTVMATHIKFNDKMHAICTIMDPIQVHLV